MMRKTLVGLVLSGFGLVACEGSTDDSSNNPSDNGGTNNGGTHNASDGGANNGGTNNGGSNSNSGGSGQGGSGSTSNPVPSAGTAVFVIAGQSNAEGFARFSGYEAIRDADPTNQTSLRDAYRNGIGQDCNPDIEYDEEAADQATSALLAGGLDLTALDRDGTIPGATIAAYRFRPQDASETLGPPYESDSAMAHPGHTTELSPLGPGFGHWDPDLDFLFYGPELGFGLHMNQFGSFDSISLVKVAMGGSNLAENWAPSGDLVEELHQRTRDHLSAVGDEAYLGGLIWFQGFNDQFEAEWRNSYAANLTTLLENCRADFGANVPVVIVQGQKGDDMTPVADAQQEVANALDNVELVPTDALSRCFHYDSVSHLVIGQQSAIKMLELWGQ